MLINIPGIILLYFVACAIGLTVLAYYSTIQCDPLVNGDVSSENQVHNGMSQARISQH